MPLPMPQQGQNPQVGQSPQMGMQQPQQFASGMMPQMNPAQKEQMKLQRILQAIDLLRNDKLRGFRIDIETDSTIQGDAMEEKQARIEFIQGVTQFIQTAGTMALAEPDFAPLAAKMLQFGVRGFRVGRDLESAIEEFCEKAQMTAKMAASQPKPPNPDMIKAQTEQMKAQAEIQRQQVENQGEQANAQLDLLSKKFDMMMKQMDMQIAAMKASHEQQKASMEMVQSEREHEMQMVQHHQKMMHTNEQHEQKMKNAVRVPAKQPQR